MAAKKLGLERSITLSFNQAAAFLAAFVVVGGYFVVQTYAASRPLPAGLSVTPNPVQFTNSNQAEQFQGCGYQANTGTTIVVNTPSAVSFFGGMSDASGCINISHNGFITSPGTYYAKAWQDNAKSHKAVLMGQATLTVQP